MPLKIRVKPEGKIFAGGAILKNVSARPVDLLILSDSPVLREEYLMNVERKDESDISNVYFLLQVVYLYKGKGKPLDDLVIKTLHSFGILYPALREVVEEVVQYLDAGDSFKALRVAHKLLADHQQPTTVAEAPVIETPAIPVHLSPSKTTAMGSLA